MTLVLHGADIHAVAKDGTKVLDNCSFDYELAHTAMIYKQQRWRRQIVRTYTMALIMYRDPTARFVLEPSISGPAVFAEV